MRPVISTFMRFTKTFSLLALYGLFAVTLPVQAQTFLSAAPDIPLAPGLAEKVENALIFDKAQGRIVTMEAMFAPAQDNDESSDKSSDNQNNGDMVLEFYSTVLPNLGWQRPTDGWESPKRLTFARGNESLNIRIEGDRIIFTLRPL